MINVTLELDLVSALEGPWQLDGLEDFGTVLVEVVQEQLPATGHSLCHVSGPKAAVFAWLLAEYTGGNVEDALEYLRLVPEGGSRLK